MDRYGALLQPFTIKGVTFKNRIMSTGHAPGYAKDSKPQERYQLYHEEKAKGGVGLSIFGGSTTVAVDSPANEYNQISAADDSVVPYFQEFAARMHGHGAKLMIQLTHIGRKMQWQTDPWLAPIGPSRVREIYHRSHPKEMEEWDIRRVILAFGQAARRCQEGGLDGFELHCAFQALIDSFWSPEANRRTDKYGGNLENRMRFGFEVFDEVRKLVGDDYVVGIRMSGDELYDQGLTPDDCVAIAKAHVERGYIDFVDVLGGGFRNSMDLDVSMASMRMPVTPFLYLASRIKQEIGVAVIHGQRVPDVETAARAIEDGHCDLVGMTRPHIADPHIVRKLMAGDVDNIRPCVGSNYCIDRVVALGEALCVHNPATSRERFMPHSIPRAATRRKVVVVGAGPGGLEAARVAAERGHAVVLFEADDKCGGQINIAAKAPQRESLDGITRWLEGQIGRLGVDLRLATPADAAMVMAETPDYVIIATGGEADLGDFDGADLAVSSWDILSGAAAPGDNVMVYDDDGRHAAVSTAEFMTSRGVAVEVVTPDRHVAWQVGPSSQPQYLKRLYDGGAILTPDHRLTRLYREGNKLIAVLANELNGEEEEREVDQVVAERGSKPRDGVYFDLTAQSRNLGEVDLEAMVAGGPQTIETNPAGGFMLFRVGDALASRDIHAAIYDSLRLCKEF